MSVLIICFLDVKNSVIGNIKMKGRTVHYKYGYKIVIRNRFYELSAGRRVLYYGESKHRLTPQEVWDRTMGKVEEKENGNKGIEKTES